MKMEWMRKIFHRYQKTVTCNRQTENLYKAKKHALLALKYWKDCNEEADLHFKIEKSSIYVRLGK
jgi:hypothetical protein